MYCLSVELNDVGWQDRAACKGRDNDLFFNYLLQPLALEICEGCGVRQVCLQWRMDTLEPWEKDHGVWGGTTPKERAVLRIEGF